MANTTFKVDSVGGISGSLTQLVDGSSYLIAGDNVSITSQSNGSVKIAALFTASTSSISGIYGDGSDGAVTVSTDTTLSRDMYYLSLSVNAGHVLYSNGYRIFVAGSCNVSGTLDNSGFGGTNGNSVGGVGAPAGSLLGGGNGGNAPNGNGQNVDHGVEGIAAHGGGGFNAGAFGTYTALGASYGSIRSLPDAISLRCYDPTSGVSGDWKGIKGGAGGGASGGSTGAGGGGGLIVLVAASINITSTGQILANGGNGDGDSAGGSGGGGGGLIVLVSQMTVNNAGTIAAAGGIQGSGHGGNPGQDGGDGLVLQLIAS